MVRTATKTQATSNADGRRLCAVADRCEPPCVRD